MLLRAVREVAAVASPGHPSATTQRAFDAAREDSPGHAGLPPARRITERLGLSWREVLAVAHEPEAEQNRLLAVKTREPAEDWLTAGHAATVLGLVAARLGRAGLSQRDYRVERERIAARDRTRWRNGARLLLPTDAQVIAAVGSWDDALRAAGLATLVECGGPAQRPAPTLVDLLGRFHDAYGFQPSARELRAFARGNDVPYPSERRQRFSAAVAEWRANRRAAGLPEPRVVMRPGGRGKRAPAYSADVGAARAGEHRRAKWTPASCAAAVACYLRQLPAGARSTERGYAEWAADQRAGTVPAMSTILALGGWEAIRQKALAMIRDAMR